MIESAPPTVGFVRGRPPLIAAIAVKLLSNGLDGYSIVRRTSSTNIRAFAHPLALQYHLQMPGLDPKRLHHGNLSC